MFWSLICDMEMLKLRSVRSIRSRNFKLLVESLEKMLPLFFALGHLNYARWLSVHLNLESLFSTNSIYAAFLERNFVVTKTLRNFSFIPIDHGHEQNNKLVKGDGGTIGLRESTSELTRWMICGPEIVRIGNELKRRCLVVEGERLFIYITNKPKASKMNSPNMLYL